MSSVRRSATDGDIFCVNHQAGATYDWNSMYYNRDSNREYRNRCTSVGGVLETFQELKTHHDHKYKVLGGCKSNSANRVNPNPPAPRPADPVYVPPVQFQHRTLDLNAYCARNLGDDYQARLVENNAYGWKCTNGNNSVGMNLDKACQQQHGNGSRPLLGNYNDPYSWSCQI